MVRGGYTTAATSKVEHIVIIVNSWKPLTIITKRPILDVGCCNSPRSTSVQNTVVIHKLDESISKKHFVTFCKFKERLVTFC